MIEEKKYYSESILAFLSTFIIFTSVLLFMLIMDSSGIKGARLALYWVIIIILVVFITISIIGIIQIKRKNLYIYYKGDTLYMHTIFSHLDKVNMTHGYDIQKSKGEIINIIIKDQESNNSLLIDSSFGVNLLELQILLDKQKKRNS